MPNEKKYAFGISGVIIFDRATGRPLRDAQPYAILGNASVNMNTEVAKLMGGNNPFAWHSENTTQDVEVTINIRQVSDGLTELFMGELGVLSAASAVGAVGTAENVNGTSVIDAVTGIASITAKAGSEAELATTKYLVVPVSPTTVNIYAYEDLESENGGVTWSYQDGLAKINVAPIAIVAATAVDIPGTGLEMTGGSGAITMTIDDSASVESTSPSLDSFEITLGSKSQRFKEVGLRLISDITETGEVMIVDIFRCKPAGGFALPFNENAFLENELSFTVLYDCDRGGVLRAKRTKVDLDITNPA